MQLCLTFIYKVPTFSILFCLYKSFKVCDHSSAQVQHFVDERYTDCHTLHTLITYLLFVFFLSSVPTGPAQDLNITVVSSDQALIMWEAPVLEDQNGVISGYTINVTLVRTGQSFQRTSTTTAFLLDGLLPFTTYTCSVAAMTSVGVGPYTIAASFITEEAGEY